MPIAFLFIGIIFLIASVRGTHKDLFELLKSDFTGQGNFLYWIVAIWVIGAIGYYKPLKPVSNAFMVLVVLVVFLSNKGFFTQFVEQIGSTESSGNDAGGISVNIGGAREFIHSGIDLVNRAKGLFG